MVIKNKLKIAILGSRGIPAKYGGFESITQELSIGLANRGCQVYVACESNWFKLLPYANYKGVMLVYFPIISSIRVIGEFLYDLLAVVWASFRVDVIYMLGYGSVVSLVFPRLLGKVVVVNVDGLEWKRRKFHPFLRFILKCFEMITVKVANYVVVDSRNIGFHYQRNYSIESVYIPNAVREIEPHSSVTLVKFNLKELEYYLVVARLEPENNIDLIIEGFKRSKSKKKLVIVGNLIKTDYISQLVQLKGKNDEIMFMGGIYDKNVLTTLRYYCYAYLHGHEVGGTSPSLLEALSCSNAIISLDVPYNREVLGNAALYFKRDPLDLEEQIHKLENDVDLFEMMKKNGYLIYNDKYKVQNMVSSFEAFLMNIFPRFRSNRFLCG